MIQQVGIKAEVAEYVQKVYKCLLDVPQQQNDTEFQEGDI